MPLPRGDLWITYRADHVSMESLGKTSFSFKQQLGSVLSVYIDYSSGF